MRFAIIGTGNMGCALLNGFLTGGILEKHEIAFYDIYEPARMSTQKRFGIPASDSISAAVSDADYVLMAVKPQQFDEVLTEVNKSLAKEAIVLSIAAAVNTARIGSIIGPDRKFVRIMPNTPAQVGAGVSAVCPVNLNEKEIDFVTELFKTCGEVIVCDEKTLDYIGCVSGTGPAYVMLFIEAMADAAVALGIKRADALKIAAATVMGSGKLCLETGMHPAVLKDQVCSPGGTTIAGVMALEENGLRNSVIKSVLAARDRTEELGKK